jgi:hypothetical protein
MSNNLSYEVVESRDNPGEWRAEAIDFAGDGECFIAIFTGPLAMDRAREYAAWKNAQAKPATRRQAVSA